MKILALWEICLSILDSYASQISVGDGLFPVQGGTSVFTDVYHADFLKKYISCLAVQSLTLSFEDG
jgi:hypothetical protein